MITKQFITKEIDKNCIEKLERNKTICFQSY